MKNIHLIKTDKPSRLHLWTDENGTRPALCELEYSHTRNTQHIYITSYEEIKEGDWIFNEEREPSVLQCIGKGSLRGWNKIILTTDPDLIKDGVQAIDDEFLQWFVKNPNCDEVKLEYRYNFYAGKYLTHYKIIIPKEEPTAYHYLSCCRSIEECHCGKYPKQELERGITITHVGRQETLEESAERIAMTKDWDFESSEGNGYYDYVEGFTEGAKSDAAKDYWYAKWQSERRYSEEDIFEFSQWISHEDWVYLPSKGYWVNEEQEELEQKLNSKEILNMWFEQFKKK